MVLKCVEYLPRDRPDYPRPAGAMLGVHDLLPGDVLLSRGSTPISDAIVAADGGSYSHAALWSGSGVIESTLSGAGEQDWTGDRDVYRYREDSGGLHAGAAEKIVATARKQLDLPYAEGELMLLACLFTLGHVPRRSLLNAALGFLGHERAEQFEDWLASRFDERSRRVCSELVALSYYRGCRTRRYALRVVPRDQRPPWSSSGIRRVESNAPPAGQERRERKIIAGNVAVSAATGAALPLATPADLQFSPSLVHVGRIIQPDAAGPPATGTNEHGTALGHRA